MSLENLKANRKSSISDILAEMDKFNQKPKFDSKEDDERFWYPAVDKAGNADALIRFLPACESEKIPFVRFFEHTFQGPTGQWIVREMCPTTRGGKCPICEYNRTLWNSGNQAQASKQKRRLQFISNIYIIKDPATPENEGQVRLYRYGKKVWDKIHALMHPNEELGEEAINPFDPIGPDKDGDGGGCNFFLKIRKVDNFPNYDESKFDSIKPLVKDEKKLKEILSQCYPIQPFVADSVYHTEDEIRAKLNRVLGLDGTSMQSEESPFVDEEESEAEVSLPVKSKAKKSDDFELSEEDFKNLADL
jgi:hypothetical protein